MIKQSFKKEPYTAPRWTMYAITVERSILDVSNGRPGEDEPIIDDDEDY